MADLIDVGIDALLLIVGGVFLLAFPNSLAKPDSSDYEKGRKRTLSRTIGLVMLLAGLAYAGVKLTKPGQDRTNQEDSTTFR